MSWKNQCAGALVLIVVFVGCSKSDPNHTAATTKGKVFAVTADSADFYHYGPQQGSGPDKKLEKGTLLTLIRPSFGYCKVKLSDGEQGFVATEEIGAASDALVAAASAPAQSRNARFRFDSPDPRLVTPPEPLPEFEPTPIPVDPSADR
jgi:hypothetical protein